MNKRKEFATMCFSTRILCAWSIILFVAVHNCDCGTQNNAEAGGKNRCGKDEFFCSRTGLCISNDWVCDGHGDCPDQEDENNCPLVNKATALIGTETVTQSTARQTTGCGHCRGRKFYCDSSEHCIPDVLVCDGNTDCTQGEDERNCP